MHRVTLCLALLLALVALPAPAATDHHTLIEVDIQSPAADAFIRDHQGRLDVLTRKPGQTVQIAATKDALDLLREAGLEVRVLIEDMETRYSFGDKVTNFGIWHTYSENAAFIDSLRLLYPQVISEKWSIGQTHEGRDIWAFKVSDNPDVDEDEPEILIDGMHHAREIMASEFPIMFAEYLAQNYGTDPEITWLVDNRELYLVPIVNPDGVVYNETTNPNGGGMWRKNRRNNGSSYGVDLNRNYPYQWGYDDVGSSPTPSSDVYRGPTAGSEPETQAMMAFINGREFVVGNSVHTYSNLLLYPWGFHTGSTADDAKFDMMAAVMCSQNGYTYGQPGEVLYEVNGGSFDWSYGAQNEHAKMLAFSSEIGGSSDGFWPSESRRGPLFQENIWPHIYLMRVAGPFLAVHSPVVNAAAKAVDPGDSGEFSFTLENQGVAGSAPAGTVTIRTDDPWVQFTEAQRSFGSLPAMGSVDFAGDPIPFTVDPACPHGHAVELTVTVSSSAGDLDFDLAFTVGQPVPVFADDFESGAGNWTRTGTWNTTAAYAHSPANSLTDSPAGDYSDQTSTSATLDGTFQATRLTFWTGYAIESGWDYGYVQISADGGPWSTVETYTGFQNSWVFKDIDLSAYAGQDLGLRFLLDTDYSVIEDGWYIDDVMLYGAGSSNQPPTVPEPAPPSGIGGSLPDPLDLAVLNSSDPEGDPVTYGFRVYSDLLCTQLVAAVDDVPEGTEGATLWTAPALPDGTYWWRAYAADPTGRSLLCEPTGILVDDTSSVDGAVLGTSLRVLGATGGTARLELTRPAAGDVSVDVFDARGALVRRLHTGYLGQGPQVLVWDGKNGRGASAASGIYFVKVRTGGSDLIGRVVLVR
ncbi:hypothetical protein KJ682_10825 [bacterium]|nr:hypothetical protein [bacterium]